MRDRQDDVLDADSIEDDIIQWFDYDDEEMITPEAPKLGRPRIPEQWSRCINIQSFNPQQQYTYDLASDLQIHSANVSSLPQRNQNQLIFWPKDYYPGLSGWDMEVHQLQEPQLRQYGQQISQMRSDIRNRAVDITLQMQDEQDIIPSTLKSITKLSKRNHRGYFYRMETKNVKPKDVIEDIAPPDRKQGRLRKVLSLNEKLQICQKVLVDYEKYKDVAKYYRITVNRVSQLISKAKKQPNMLQELVQKKQETQQQAIAITNVLDVLIEADEFIDSVDYVKALAEAKTGDKYTFTFVIKVMHDYGMKYRKVHQIPVGGNSNRSLILRQRCVMALLSQPPNTRFICIDETWLGMSDFRRRKWQAPKSNNSVAALNIIPRVTMLLAVDSYGNHYVTLAQSNSNRQVFGMFLRHLVEKLNQEDSNWRNNSVVMMDGASYHCADITKTLITKLQIPVLMFGPYSYNASPCELYFAAFKSVDINPRHYHTSKNYFRNVVEMVIERCKQLPKHQLVLNWHHCLLYVFKYLDFYKL